MEQILEEDTQHGRYETEDYIKGIINLRGTVIPVIDMRLRFCKEASVYGDRTCIVVVEIGGSSVGLIVDQVSEVMSIDDSNIVLPLRVGDKGGSRFIKAIGKVGNEAKLLLDCFQLINTSDLPAAEDNRTIA